jgi:hypothetical protein
MNTQIVIPIGTFFLGVLFTLYLRKKESRSEIISHYAEEICLLSENWYNKISELSLSVLLNNMITNDDILKYKNNSMYLTKYRKAIIILKKHKKAKPLVEEGEKFLKLVSIEYNYNIDSIKHSDFRTFRLNKNFNKYSKCKYLSFNDINIMNNKRIDRNNSIDNDCPFLNKESSSVIALEDKYFMKDLFIKLQNINCIAGEIISEL